MYDFLFSWIPIAFEPMSIVTALVIFFTTALLIVNHKAIVKELNNHKKFSTKELAIVRADHDILCKEFKNARISLDEKIVKVMDDTQKEIRALTKMINGLEIHTAEINAGNKSISTSITEIKQDVRDLRNKKK